MQSLYPTSLVSIGALLGVGVLVAACMGGDEGPPPEIPEMRPIITPSSAIEKVAMARCTREAECGNVGDTHDFSDQNHCLTATRDDLTREMAIDEDCKNGISSEDMDSCLSEIRLARCDGARGIFDAWRASMECRSAELCMD